MSCDLVEAYREIMITDLRLMKKVQTRLRIRAHIYHDMTWLDDEHFNQELILEYELEMRHIIC